MFPTKLYGVYLLAYVLDLCQLFGFSCCPSASLKNGPKP